MLYHRSQAAPLLKVERTHERGSQRNGRPCDSEAVNTNPSFEADDADATTTTAAAAAAAAASVPEKSASAKALWGKLKQKSSLADVVLAVRAADKWKAKIVRMRGGEDGEEGLSILFTHLFAQLKA